MEFKFLNTHTHLYSVHECIMYMWPHIYIHLHLPTGLVLLGIYTISRSVHTGAHPVLSTFYERHQCVVSSEPWVLNNTYFNTRVQVQYPCVYKGHRSLHRSKGDPPLHTKEKVNRIDLIFVPTPKLPKFCAQIYASNANRQINSVNGIGHLMNLIGLDPNMA